MGEYNISQYEIRGLALSSLQAVFNVPGRVILLQGDECGLCDRLSTQIKQELKEFEEIKPYFQRLINLQNSAEEKRLLNSYKSKYGIHIPKETGLKEISVEKPADIEKLIKSYEDSPNENGYIYLVLDPGNLIDMKKLKEYERETYCIEIAKLLPYISDQKKSLI